MSIFTAIAIANQYCLEITAEANCPVTDWAGASLGVEDPPGSSESLASLSGKALITYQSAS